MKYLELLMMKTIHLLDWFKRLFVGPKPWQQDLSHIVSGLYLGGFFETWPGSMEVINVAEENHYQPPLGCLYLSCGRPDLPPAQTPPELQWTVDLIVSWLGLGYSVAVVCDAGLNRSALVVCAYIAFTMHLSAEKAREFVAAKRGRPILHDFQFAALQQYVASLSGKTAKPNDF